MLKEKDYKMNLDEYKKIKFYEISKYEGNSVMLLKNLKKEEYSVYYTYNGKIHHSLTTDIFPKSEDEFERIKNLFGN